MTPIRSVAVLAVCCAAPVAFSAEEKPAPAIVLPGEAAPTDTAPVPAAPAPRSPQVADVPAPVQPAAPVAPVAPAATAAAPRRTAFYTFLELLNKAERIVTADIGPTSDGRTLLIVRESLKAPAADRATPPDELRRQAENILRGDAPVAQKPRGRAVYVQAAGMKLPAEGTEALLFLWEPQPGTAAEQAVYTVSHPQNVYETDVVPQVRAALTRPRSVADGRYLRAWDREMAMRARQREADAALAAKKGGEEVAGFVIGGRRAKLSLRSDNSFHVTTEIQNKRTRETSLYSGPANGFGVVLTPRNDPAAEPLLLRASTRDLVTDPSVLALSDITDFSALSPGGSLVRELLFDVQDFPVLRMLRGPYNVRVFFSTEQDGRGLDLSAPAWTGAMISEPLQLDFPAQAGK